MSTVNPKIIIIAGPNGAGKSTLAPALIKEIFGLLEYVNADTIALGLSAFAPDSVAFQAGRVMLKRLHDLAAGGQSFAFESTLATRSYVSWINGLKAKGYSFHLIYLWLRNADLAIERVKERVRLGGHDVPEEVIRRRYQKGLGNFFTLYQPLAETWAFYDNSLPGQPLVIASGKGKSEITIFDDVIWGKLGEVA